MVLFYIEYIVVNFLGIGSMFMLILMLLEKFSIYLSKSIIKNTNTMNFFGWFRIANIVRVV